jgi:GH18 family chitinase
VTTSASGGGEGPYGGTPAAIPGKVLASNYDLGGQGVAYDVSSINGTGNTYRSDGVDLEATTDTGGGYDLGWTAAGQWFKYTVKVATAGTYTVTFRVAAESAVTDAFHLSSSSGTNLSGSVNVPNTGGWQTWTNVTATVTLSAGQQTLTFNQDNGGWNINYFTFATGTTGGGPRLVGYLPDYDGSYATFAQTLNFNKMTHLNFAFGNPPTCNGTCTASSNMSFSLGQTNSDIATLVNAAHAAGVKVILSIGGGGGDQQIIQFYNAGLSAQLVASLNSYVTEFNLDGVDLDIEDPNNMGTPYATFAADLVSTFHPQNKIVTAAVAEYLQSSMPTSTLLQFDFVNIMNYSNLSDAQTAMAYFSSLGEPGSKMVLGVPFFGQSADGNTEETYATILAAYPGAGGANEVSGGSLDGGIALYYVGDAMMAQETQLGAQYGGIMIWELSQDAAPPNSLLTIIQNNL